MLEITDHIVAENGLTTIMITHNMRDAINHGNRLVMLDNGTVAVDIRKEDYPNLSVQDLLQMFEKASGDAILSDALLLSWINFSNFYEVKEKNDRISYEQWEFFPEVPAH